MIDILITLGLFGFALIGIILPVFYLHHSIINEEEPTSDPCVRRIYIPKIKDGSKLSIGIGHFITVIKVDQHFNLLQKKMWKFLLGIKVEDYSEDD